MLSSVRTSPSQMYEPDGSAAFAAACFSLCNSHESSWGAMANWVQYPWLMEFILFLQSVQSSAIVKLPQFPGGYLVIENNAYII
jgi:hypothetical protein